MSNTDRIRLIDLLFFFVKIRTMMNNTHKYVFGVIGMLLLVVLLFLLDVSCGTVWLSPVQWLDFLWGNEPSNSVLMDIFYKIRLPKAITAILAGGALSVCGLLMQTLFRNPLVGPYTLGISSGASLGVALLTMCGTLFSVSFFNSQWSVIMVAILGAFAVLVVILLIANHIHSNVSLLIVGMMIGSLVSALVNVIQNFANPDSLKIFILWSFGSLSHVGWVELRYLLVIIACCAVGLLFLIKPLNGLLLGEDVAHSLGISIRVVQRWIILITCVLAGVITAFCGPIAFIGVAVPHLVRGFFQTSNHRITLPFSFLFGGGLLLICDIINSSLTYPLPISTLSAIIGTPIIIWVIVKNF